MRRSNATAKPLCKAECTHVVHAAKQARTGSPACYVAPALGETPDTPTRLLPKALATVIALALLTALLSACGDDDGKTTAENVTGEFPVKVTTARFPTKQLLAGTTNLKLGVENIGEETIPELAFTITTDDGEADGSFKIQLDEPELSNPNRPVWILENKYPREAGTPPPRGVSGGLRAQTNTFGFGPLEPGETRTIVWRVTPVMAGTYTLHYEVAASLDGKAKAVTRDGGAVKGEFVVTISAKPPKQTVNDKGQVVPAD